MSVNTAVLGAVEEMHLDAKQISLLAECCSFWVACGKPNWDSDELIARFNEKRRQSKGVE